VVDPPCFFAGKTTPVPPSSSPALFDQFARGWRGYVLVALIALLSSCFGAGRMQVMDNEEARFAQATREMVETGDYVRIRVQNADRHREPIGVHWLQAASVNLMAPFTERVNVAWPYRLPSAFGVMLAAIAALWAGGALFSPRQAFFGAALFASGMLVGFEGMTAKTDAVLLGLTTVAMAALARLYTLPDERRIIGSKELAVLFWVAVALGVLVKGVVTPLTAALMLATLGLWERRWAWMRPLLWWPAPVAALLIAAPWFVAVSLETSGRFIFDTVRGASEFASGESSQFSAPGYHLFLLPFLIFPATYALPAAARLAWESFRAPRTDAAHASFRFLIAWAAPVILFFELAPMKVPHQALPAYPAIALLCGAGLAAMLGRRWRTAHPAGVVLFGVAGVVIVALTATAATFMPGDFAADLRRAISAALIGIGVVAAAFTALIMLRRPAAKTAVLAACALALSFSLRDRILPEARALNVSSEAVTALTRARLLPTDERRLWVVDYNEPSLIFITRTSIRMVGAREAADRADEGDALLVEGRALQEFSDALAERGLAFTPAEPAVRGLAMGRGERVALFVGSVTDASGAAAGGRR
jgi:4-amino-4-deoxy-L-arabinose transferase-like glycosyltransferase